jgi:hypothetical protein
MKRIQINTGIFSLLLGSLIYLLFRSDSLLMFDWFDKLSILDTIRSIRMYSIPLSHKLPDWFLFSLPDGLWVCSYVTLLLLLWSNRISSKNLVWIVLIPFIALFSELGQYLDLVKGTFDIMDVTTYLIGFLIPLFVFSFKNNIQYEKHN